MPDARCRCPTYTSSTGAARAIYRRPSGLLGRLEVRGDDGSLVRIAGPARRRVLAALLCRPGVLVGAATLIEDVWGAASPRSALASLRSHVIRLRADLARGGGDRVLITEGDGYRLCVRPAGLDTGRFEVLVDEAARTVDPDRAIGKYDEALELWRDDAYVEFGDAAFAVIEDLGIDPGPSCVS